MREFAALYRRLDQTQSTLQKVQAMVDYLDDVDDDDAAWSVFFLSGEQRPQPVKRASMVAWALEYAGVERWMYDACYTAVGDQGETLSLLIDASPYREGAARGAWTRGLSETVAWIGALRGLAEVEQRDRLREAWTQMTQPELFLLFKLMRGALRVGVSRKLVVRALSRRSGVEPATLLHRMMGTPVDSAARYRALLSADEEDADASRPYPFFLAAPLDGGPEALGAPDDWVAEWKWDGIRGQIVRRGDVWIWSRGEELVTSQFPEVARAAEALPDGTVVDGELLAWGEGPMPFQALQRRLGRKRLGKKLLSEVPCRFMIYDVMERDGEDLREVPLEVRREAVESLGRFEGFEVSAQVGFETWAELAARRGESRARLVEGLMLKRRDSPYRVGRVRGDWWKWKVDPLEIDAVMIYAQAGHGRRAGLHTDYTFAVWRGDELVPVAKAYSGLSNEEIRELDGWIRKHTTEKFGPVRAVEPEQVFELHFDAVGPSTRHKSGVAMRFPRIARWKRGRAPAEANTLEDVERLIHG